MSNSPNPYDELPYRSFPIEWTAPERLALVPLLYGGPRLPLDYSSGRVPGDLSTQFAAEQFLGQSLEGSAVLSAAPLSDPVSPPLHVSCSMSRKSAGVALSRHPITRGRQSRHES